VTDLTNPAHMRDPTSAKGVGVVTATTLNVRSGPGTSFPVVGKLAQGTTVDVWAVATNVAGGDWWLVQAGTLTGWCHSDWLEPPRLLLAQA